MIKELKTCEICLKRKGDVEYVTDPFEEELNDRVVKRNLCTRCYNDLVLDI